MTNLLHIAFLWINLTNVSIQVEPEPWRTEWFASYGRTNWLIYGSAKHTACVGNMIKVYWDADPEIILQESYDLCSWHDIRVRFYYVGEYYVIPSDIPYTQKFYRLKRKPL